MEWKNFFQIIIAFSILVISIIVFQFFKLDTNFLITFVLAMFSLGISIYFFIQSNTISNEIKERLITLSAKINPNLINYDEESSTLSDKEIENLNNEGDNNE